MNRMLAIAVVLTLVLIACFEVPLAKPEAGRLDSRFDGLWITQEKPGADYMTLFVVPFDDHAYCISLGKFDSKGVIKAEAGVPVMRGWITSVAGSSFLSCEPVQQLLPEFTKAKDYMVGRISFEPSDTLGFQPVNYQFQDARHAQTSAALTRIVEENIHDPHLLDEVMSFRRFDETNAVEKAILDLIMRT